MRKLTSPALKERYINQYSLHGILPEEIIDLLELRVLDKDEYIYHQDDNADIFYLLLEGKLQIDYLHSNGKLTVLSFVEPLFAICDLELFNDITPVKNVVALEECKLFSVSMDKLRYYGHDNNKFLHFLIRQIVLKIETSSNRVVQTGLTLDKRLILYIYQRMRNEGTTFNLENRQALAAMLGTTSRHLNRTFDAFFNDGICHVENKTLQILNIGRLTSLAEEL